jgi:hypothetical protein
MPTLMVLYPTPTDVATFERRNGKATAAHAFEISTGGPPVFLVCEDA